MPVTEEQCLLGGGLDGAHRDPFDRLLAARAMVESMISVTDDAAFDGLSALRIAW